MPHDPFIDQSQDQGGPQMPQLKAGQRLFNRRYELRELRGAGGMGVVWLAWDHTEEIDVALKFLPSVLALQEREMQRLREEVRAGKELRHEHLVATFGMELEDGIAAIVMEYVPGQTLRQKLEDAPAGFLEPEEISAWVQDVCEGLSYLHEKARRIHRDLKPANIMINAEGRAKLMDFGISHRIKESVSRHSKTSEGQASGSSSTLAYASPQQLKGEPSDKADDLYSLGATLYELLTGTPPFFRGGVEAVAHQIKTEPVTPILKRRRELVAEGLNSGVGQPVATAWESAVLACLAKALKERPASARALWQALATPAKVLPSFRRSDRPPAKKTVISLEARAAANSSPPHLPPPHRLKLVSTLLITAAMLIGGLGLWVLVSKPEDIINKFFCQVVDTAKAMIPPSPLTKALPRGTTATATKEAPFENSLGMLFVPVPIGAGESQGKRVLFNIWETRSKDYAAFIKSGTYSMSGSNAENWKTYSCKGVPVGRGEGESAEESSHPVANVSYDDAVAFCAWLTKKDRASGLIGPQDAYRLPTDTEWSYAVGIGDQEDASASPKDKTRIFTGIYPWGTTFPPLNNSGNYADESSKSKGVVTFDVIENHLDGHSTTSPVGSFKPNALGIYDLGGNQWEWTSSPYEPGSHVRVLRGASWGSYDASFMLSSNRDWYEASSRIINIGFRCVLVVAGG